MKFVTFRRLPDFTPRLGALVGDSRVLDLQQAHLRVHKKELSAFGSMQALIEGGDVALETARQLAADHEPDDELALPQARLLAPLPQPAQIRDCLCFEEHVIGSAKMGAKALGLSTAELDARMASILAGMRSRPIWYKANRFSISGPDETVVWPTESKVWDYELELAAVIGRKGKNIPRSAVSAHLFGFTIFNDFSARDLQGADMSAGLGPTISKDFDGGNGLGPCIVTTDEFDHNNARMVARVNGQVRCDNNSCTMTIKFEDLISFISRHETLHPGELICSGTVGGGCGVEYGEFLKDGDVVELEIEGIGTLRQRVTAA